MIAIVQPCTYTNGYFAIMQAYRVRRLHDSIFTSISTIYICLYVSYFATVYLQDTNMYVHDKYVICSDAMKLAKVIPLFKTGDKGFFSNYRPVSLLPQISY